MKLYKSKTIIFNLLLVALGVFAPFDDSTKSILIANGLIGLGLRTVTSKPLDQK